MPRTESWPFRTNITPDDPEFEAKVRAQSVAETDPGISRADAAHVKTRAPLNLKGFTPKQGTTDHSGLAAELLPFMDGEVPDIQAGRVYGVGPDGVSAQVWAHEFRHKNAPQMAENDVRLLDAFMAGSRKQWDEAVRSWQNRKGFDSYEEAARSLVDNLRYVEHEFAKRNGREQGVFSNFTRPKPLHAPYRHWIDEE